jgi:flagellar basal-body rod protein FlgG
MEAQQSNLDVIANNLANVNTTGFKRSKIEFQDLLYDTTRAAGAEAGSGTQLPTGLQVGHGSRVVATSKVFTEGQLTQTGEQLDLAINGDGFFQGQITTSDGLPLQGGWQPIAAGTNTITISSTGAVTASSASGAQNFTVQLVRFTNPAGLNSVGGNLYTESLASGTPETGTPGENGYGTLQQGYLEMSNVKVVQEMVNMITAQRAYEVNSKSVQSADEMMQESNNLRR